MMGQQNLSFKLKVFWQWIANAVYHSIILYIFAALIWDNDLIQGDGKTAGHWVWGTALYGAVLLTVLGKAGLVSNNWTKYHVMAIPGSMAVWYVFIAAYGSVAPLIPFSAEYHGVVPRLYTSPIFWLQTVALAALCLLRDFAWKYAKRMYRPQTYHHIQEIQKYNIQDYRPRCVPYLLDRLAARTRNMLTSFSEWSNSKKPFARSAKCSVCASNAATPFRRPTSPRPACCRRTTPPRTVAATVKWPVQDRSKAGWCEVGETRRAFLVLVFVYMRKRGERVMCRERGKKGEHCEKYLFLSSLCLLFL